MLLIAASLRIGGAEKVAADIGLYADPQKYAVHYVVFGDDIGAYEPELEARGCKIFHLPQPADSYRAYMKNLKKLIRTYHYDVIHAHTMFNIGWAMLAGKLYGVPVRVSHAHSALEEHRSIKVRLYEAAMRFLILTCATDYIACGVKAGERLYGKKAFKKKGTLILNGIDTQGFAFDEQRREVFRKGLGLDDKFIIGHAGHLAEVKNQSFLLSLMPEILKRQPQAYLLLLGEGEERPMLENYIHENHLEESAKLLGCRENPYCLMNAADLLVCSSVYEGFSTFVTEGLILGKPIVTTDVSGMRELLGDSEYGLVTANDDEAFYEGVRRMLTEQGLMQAYAKRAKQRGKDFSGVKLARDTEKFLIEKYTEKMNGR